MIITSNDSIAGVFSAAITPLCPDFSPDREAIPLYLDFLAKRGCHGALLLGTTGEGPSFDYAGRLVIYHAALEIKQVYPAFFLLAGTGTPSLEETIRLTRAAFDYGFNGVVVLPPYYFRKVGDDGIFLWFQEIFHKAVPTDGALLGYHIPGITGVPFSIELLTRLKDAYPGRFVGLKDSSGDPEFAKQLGSVFGNDLAIFSGNDCLFTLALQAGAAGCITAPANLISPLLRSLWESFMIGNPDPQIQTQINTARAIIEGFPPAPSLLKAILARHYGFPRWPVCPPLESVSIETEEQVLKTLELT